MEFTVKAVECFLLFTKVLTITYSEAGRMVSHTHRHTRTHTLCVQLCGNDRVLICQELFCPAIPLHPEFDLCVHLCACTPALSSQAPVGDLDQSDDIFRT